MNNLTDRDHSELMMLYQALADNIEKAKQWGWTVAFTTMGAQGAVLGLYTAYKSEIPIQWIRSVFVLLVCGFAFVATNYIRYSQGTLKICRDRMKATRMNFGDPFKKCLGESNAKKEWPLEPTVWCSTVWVILLILALKNA